MKKIVVPTMTLSILMVALCLTCYALDFTSQITLLKQKTERLQSQINQAKLQSEQGLDPQMKAIAASIDSLVKQRVQLDAHIATLENQMSQIKKNAQSNLTRQVKDYKDELGSVKQELAGLVAKQSPQETQKVNEAPKPAAAGKTVPPHGK
ncbi:MAG: hypothetical protein WBG50_05440 [Desulfomonilaceae bacterium]